ncbi:MAG: macro domain-containing protein [Nanoarchaeota archaeon]
MEKDYQIGKGKIELRNGSITRYKADALVCPNIPDLEMVAIPGGCQFAFFAEGGEDIFLEARKIAERKGKQSISSAHLTTAGRLPAKYVIHSVGPHTSDKIIRGSTKNVLELIANKGLNSVGFPTLGTGLYDFPLDKAVEIMSNEFLSYLSADNSIQRVGLILYGADSYRIGQKILDAKFK